MKKLILILVLLVTVYSCKAQIYPSNVVPIENFENHDFNGRTPEGTYIKDVNHLLDKYEGTWTGAFDNKTYEIVINKTTDSFLGVQEDELLLRYKITNASGSEIINILNLPDDSASIVGGQNIKNGGNPDEYYVLFYQGESYKCGQIGDMFIYVSADNSNQLNLRLVPSRHSIRSSQCPNGHAQQLFPTDSDSMVLTKQ